MSRVMSTCMILKPLPLVVRVGLHEARLVVERPSVVKFSKPDPEPFPEIGIHFCPGDPVKIVRHRILLVRRCEKFTNLMA